MSTTISLTRAELKRRRQLLLDRTGLSRDQLQAWADSYTLQPDQREAFEAIRAIDYLLGDD